MSVKVKPDRQFSFVAECTLGRLCKWLRLAGFDTVYDPRKPNAQWLAGYSKTQARIVLTRTKHVFEGLLPMQAIFIQRNAPLDQVRQVMRQLGIRQQDLQPLTRCATCNVRVVPCPEEKLIGRIPDYIGQRHNQFHYCPRCQKIFWPGSHAQRCLEAMQEWFSE